MAKALIKMVCKQSFDADSIATDFKKACFQSSYDEFLMKSQAYNLDNRFDTFSDMKNNDGRSNSLHYKTGFAVSGYIGLLNKKMPSLFSTLGEAVAFDTYQFELIESSITDKSKHRFAIHYITDSLTLVDSFGETLLLAYGDKRNEEIIEGTFMVKLGDGVSITSYQ